MSDTFRGSIRRRILSPPRPLEPHHGDFAGAVDLHGVNGPHHELRMAKLALLVLTESVKDTAHGAAAKLTECHKHLEDRCTSLALQALGEAEELLQDSSETSFREARRINNVLRGLERMSLLPP